MDKLPLLLEYCHVAIKFWNLSWTFWLPINLMSDIFKIALHQLRFQDLFSSLGTRLALYLEIERNYRKNGYKLLIKRYLGLPVWKSVSDQMIGNGIKNNDQQITSNAFSPALGSRDVSRAVSVFIVICTKTSFQAENVIEEKNLWYSGYCSAIQSQKSLRWLLVSRPL